MADKKVYRILTINPGSTSTKIGIFDNEECVCEKSLHHSSTHLDKYETVWDQYEFRKIEIIKFLETAGYDLKSFHAVVGRGGLVKPIESGTYQVDQRMINDLRRGVQGHHASNLGGVLAYGIGWDFGMPAFIVDPPAVDELQPISRLSGMADIPRRSLFHALNIKATALKHCAANNKKLTDVNLIVAHLGGGITVAALERGRIIDVNDGLSEGPFTPERSGSIPTLPLVELCFSGKFTFAEIKKKLVGGGGLVSYLGTNDAREAEDLVHAGHDRARLIYEAMAFQVAKEIGSRAVALSGQVDAIILTGGIARSEPLVNWIKERTEFIAPIHIHPGENELEALALGGLRVLRGEETPRMYDAQEKTIGVYYSEFIMEYEVAVDILEKRLRELGYRFRQADENCELLIRNCQREPEKMSTAFEEFIDREVDLIIAIGSPAAQTAKPYLKDLEIPLVCMACFDPVVMGLAEGYADPNRRLTGTCYRVEIKEQIKEGLLPICQKIKRLGIVYRSGQRQSEIQMDEAQTACATLDITAVPFDAQSPDDLQAAAAFFKKHKVEAVYLGSDTAVAGASEKQLAKLVTNFPTLCALESTIHKGGLVGRIASWEKICNDASSLSMKVLEGMSLAQLPIVRNPEPQTVINVDSAKKLKLKLKKEFVKKAAKTIKGKGQ